MAHKSPAMSFFELGMGPHNALFAQLSARELVRLMQTCRLIYDLAHQICFNPMRLLCPFFGDPTQVERFQQIQAETQILISGSIALQYFDRTTYPESDLDPYAYGKFAVRSHCDVYKQLAAPIVAKPKLSNYPMPNDIADVLDFTKWDKKIQLILAKSTPIEVILDFHSTCVMNVLTHAHAYAFYPQSTFLDRRAWEIGIDEIGGRGEARRKYVNRGRQMVSTPACREFAEGIRWVGGHFTWTLPLERRRASVPEFELISTNSWRLEMSSFYGIPFESKHSRLQYDYFVIEAEWSRKFTRDQVKFVLVFLLCIYLSVPSVCRRASQDAYADRGLLKLLVQHREGLLKRRPQFTRNAEA
ncbi:hypothetical protein FB45DRAFT_1142917 [Roridomyces roridus]|uniref:F-box domain-containing protein n=1 Tax=Roridomyces roridus TaxID=1738132 RepID=A0AAD7BZT7_9AGAR|nr:hypothetical protein FB45DRAFT_1142917 [Roridomyces roridus]